MTTNHTATVPHNGTPTSYEAAQTISQSKIGADRQAICQFVASCGSNGATDEEIAAGCPDIHPNALRARRGECWGHGYLTDLAGETRTSATTGKKAKVWHITRACADRLGLPADHFTFG